MRTRRVWVTRDGKVLDRKPEGTVRSLGGWVVITAGSVAFWVLVVFFSVAFLAQWTAAPAWLQPVVEAARWVFDLFAWMLAGSATG